MVNRGKWLIETGNAPVSREAGFLSQKFLIAFYLLFL